MNKKIIAIAIATAMAAPVAMADIKVSGRVGGHLTNTGSNNGNAAVTTFADNGQTRLQFDGTAGNAYARIALDERLGRDNAAAGSYTRTKRDNYAGYKASFGKIQFGRMGGALKNIDKDPMIGTFLETRGTAGTAGGQFGSSSFVDHLVQYSTKAAGVKVKVQYDFGDNTAATGHEGHMAVSAVGKAGPVGYYVGFNNGTDGESSNGAQNVKLGASMKFGSVKAQVGIEQNDTNAAKLQRIQLMVGMGIGKGMNVHFGYGMNDGANDPTHIRLAVSQKLSKGASIYGGLAMADDSATDAVQTIGLGMTVKF